MTTDSGVRILTVEGRPAGTAVLRPILQAQGFDVVAHADGTVDRVAVERAHPDVVVFDEEVLAETVAATRAWAPHAGIVVVWPPSVAGLGADEQVDPARVVTDLDAAVRTVHARHTAYLDPEAPLAEPRRLPIVEPRAFAPPAVTAPRTTREKWLTLACFVSVFVLMVGVWPDLRNQLSPALTLLPGTGAFAIPITPAQPIARTANLPDPALAQPVAVAPQVRSAPTASAGRHAAGAPAGSGASAGGSHHRHHHRHHHQDHHGNGGGGGGGSQPPPNDGGGGGNGPEPPAEDGAPGNSGNAPGHTGESPGSSGNAPGHTSGSSDSAPGNSGNAPGHNKD